MSTSCAVKQDYLTIVIHLFITKSFINYYSAAHEISRFLWKQKVHCHVLNSLPLYPILNQLKLVDNLTHYCFKIKLNLTLRATSSSPK